MGCFLSKALLASFWGGGGGVQTIFKKCIFFFKVNSVTSQYSPLAHKSSWNDWPRNLDDYSKLMNELNVSFSFMSHSLTSKIVLFCFYLSFWFFLTDVFKIVLFAFFSTINGVFALSEVDCGFKERLPRTKDLRKVICVPSPLSK